MELMPICLPKMMPGWSIDSMRMQFVINVHNLCIEGLYLHCSQVADANFVAESQTQAFSLVLANTPLGHPGLAEIIAPDGVSGSDIMENLRQ